MKASWTGSQMLYLTLLGIAVWLGKSPHSHPGMCCFGEDSNTETVNEDLTQALNTIRRDKEGIFEGFQILDNTDLSNVCPDQLLALIHDEGEGAAERIWRLGRLIVRRKLAISGKQLTAEYDKAGRTGRRARQAVCVFAAYQTGRSPPEQLFGQKPELPEPKLLDEETLALLVRALTDDDPAVRVAAADSICLAGIRDDRFLDPLLKAIEDENTVVSDAASLAAAQLGFERAGPAVLRRLEADLKAPLEDRRDDLAACGLPLTPFDAHLWGDCYSPRYRGGGWTVALGILRYRPAVPVLRRMAAPWKSAEENAWSYTGGENKAGWPNDLAKAIVDIEDGSHRATALLDLAEDESLAGNVRAAALRILHDCDSACRTIDEATGRPILTDRWQQYYQPEVLQRVVKLIGDKSPMADRANNASRLGRLAVKVAASKFDPRSSYYRARLWLLGKVANIDAVATASRSFDPALVYPEDLLSIRRQLKQKLESLLLGKDGGLTLEALAVAFPEWGTREKYIGIANDPKQQPVVRVAAANLLTWQPMFLEMDGGGTRYGMNAPPETAGMLLPLLEIRNQFQDWRHADAVTHVFLALLGYPDGDLTNRQKAVRKELLPELRAMRTSPHKDAALSVLLGVYDFSRPTTAWDANCGDPSARPRPPEEPGASAPKGPPAEVVARHSFDFLGRIRLVTLANHGKMILVGDGSMLSHDSGSRLLLLDPRDLGETARTSMSEELPWSSRSAVLGRDEQHVLVFNRYIELNTLKTVSSLDVKAAVAKGNVHPNPLAISPDGSLALVHVSSYLSARLDALALFDLGSGRLERVIDVGEIQPVFNACFLDDKEIAVHGHRGCVLAVNLKTGKQRALCENGPRTIVAPGTNWHMSLLAGGRDLVVSGYNEFVVINTSQGKEVFRKRVVVGNAVPVLGERFLLYQGAGSPEPMLRSAVFCCARVSDGKVVAEFDRDRPYRTLMPSEKSDTVFGVNGATLTRIRFQWGELLQHDESRGQKDVASP